MITVLFLLVVSTTGIQERLVAPCCWNDSLAAHRSPIALEMKRDIEMMAADGKTEQQILDHYVAQYGERILRVPRGVRRTRLFAIPMVALVLGGFGLSWFLRGQRVVAPASPALPRRSVPDSDWDW